MPYKIGKRGPEFCVLKSDSGQVVKCHPSYQKALAHLQALNIHVEDAAMDRFTNGGHFIDQGLFLDLLTDPAIGQRVLAGEPVVIIPKGPFVRGGVTRDITDAVIGQFVENWEHRLDRGIRRRQLAVDTDHDGRAVGWFTNVLPMDGGIGATFRWNRKGREALQEGEYAYFSPTIYWWQEDAKGQAVENQLGGGAMTNYPFFGEETALYSMRLAGVDGGAVWYAITKSEGGVEYPARAYRVVEDPEKPTTWHLRVYSFRDGDLTLDHGLMGAAKAALTSPGGHRGRKYEGPGKQEATGKLKALYEREGLDWNRDAGGDDMSGQPGEGLPTLLQQVVDFFSRSGGTPPQTTPGAGPGAGTGGVVLDAATQQRLAQVDTLSAQVTTLATERDTLAARTQALEQALAVAEGARTLERFTQMAREQFGHLPCATGDLAGHLAWLHRVDSEQNQPHVAFFSALLANADTQFVQAFRERGHTGTQGGSALERVQAAVTAFMKDHQGVTYESALSEVFRAQPDLYALYNQEREVTQ